MAIQQNTLYLKDYQPSDFTIDSVDLTFEVEDAMTTLTNTMKISRQGQNSAPLVLDGTGLELVQISLNGEVLSETSYRRDAESLSIDNVNGSFELTVVTHLYPDQNKSFEGLYRSGKSLVTQNEAQGFRKMTYFLDRPDVMSTYQTTIIAEKEKYPVLLSNGNLVSSEDLNGGRHKVTWQDPFKKPCYLFALVAGNLGQISDHFVTRSGREVLLAIYCDHGKEDRCQHALDSLHESMKWDEEKYGREYDLDVYNIVAVDNFNAGAMENKGLNIFNSVYILADPKTATDKDYQSIRAVIAHEYFHNWTGNRITLRDWFQLSLKEGLTVFRDQNFSMDLESREVKRVDDVSLLRTRQFAEDAGPTAHPIRPQSAISVDNFFTVTIYEKGAEVIRMIQTLLGEESFLKGMDLYFEKFDGMAVTTEDFVSSFEEANQVDLSQFQLWYDQAGTPSLKVTSDYFADEQKYEIHVEQKCAPSPGQKNKKPFHIPLKISLLDSSGQALPLIESHEQEVSEPPTEKVLHLRGSKQTFTFSKVSEKPVPSLLRGFSAPVNLNFDYSNEDLAFLLAHDGDGFSRWEAGQKLILNTLLKMISDIENHLPPQTPTILLEAFGRVLSDHDIEPSFKALLLQFPEQSYVGQFLSAVDPHAIAQAHEKLISDLAQHHEDLLLTIYGENTDPDAAYLIDNRSIGRRSLKNQALFLLSQTGKEENFSLGVRQMEKAQNMTDELAALEILLHSNYSARGKISQQFYQKWKSESLVMNKWLRTVGSSSKEGTLQRVQECMQDSVFDLENPNKVYALLMGFSSLNPTQFHLQSGDAYTFIADQTLRLDVVNPHVASYLASAFNHWQRMKEPFRSLMKEQLERMNRHEKLSRNTYEIISKNLVESESVGTQS